MNFYFGIWDSKIEDKKQKYGLGKIDKERGNTYPSERKVQAGENYSTIASRSSLETLLKFRYL